jgi:hypothetical protein
MSPIPKLQSRGEKGSQDIEVDSKADPRDVRPLDEPVRNNLSSEVTSFSHTVEKPNTQKSPEDIKPSDSRSISPTASEGAPVSDDSEESPAENSEIQNVDSWLDTQVELYRIKRDQETQLEDLISIPDRSPTSSDFGTVGRSNLWWHVKQLPPGILDYLEEGKLEAYFVKTDGNCLYHAVTFHPEFTKGHLGRSAAAALIDGTHQDYHILRAMVDGEQLQKIQTRTYTHSMSLWLTCSGKLARREYWRAANPCSSRSFAP